jgi:hypothetical protein
VMTYFVAYRDRVAEGVPGYFTSPQAEPIDLASKLMVEFMAPAGPVEVRCPVPLALPGLTASISAVPLAFPPLTAHSIFTFILRPVDVSRHNL